MAFVSGLKPDVIIARPIGPGAFEKLRALGIRLVRSDDRLAEGSVKRSIGGELEEMREPEHEHGP